MLCAALIAASPARANESRYTRHDWQRCPASSTPEPRVISRRRCVGAAGIAVLWTADDDSSSVTFGSSAVDEDLNIGTFFEAGQTIEWRSLAAAGPPFAAAIRYRTGTSVGRLDRPKLVVYRLEPSGRSCVMAVIEGRAADANARARALMDVHGPSFRCGSPRL